MVVTDILSDGTALPTNFIRLAQRYAPNASASLGKRVASDWHSRFAQSLAQGCSLPIPKGGAEAGNNSTQRKQRRGNNAGATPQRYASLGHTSVRWPTLRKELPLRLPMREES